MCERLYKSGFQGSVIVFPRPLPVAAICLHSPIPLREISGLVVSKTRGITGYGSITRTMRDSKGVLNYDLTREMTYLAGCLTNDKVEIKLIKHCIEGLVNSAKH